MKAFDQSQFRQSMGQFASGIAVAYACESQIEYGITINSFTSVSLEPPLILFCLDKNTHCHASFTTAEHFSLSFLAESQQTLSSYFAQSGSKDWASIETKTHAEYCVKTISQSLASLVCKHHACYDGGDHSILVGEVLALDINPDLPPPLLYFRGDYASLPQS
jgi:3-hydroxy-9,10-secoandrosta-1,3,5(10)-triene-9,17-dione monooxygenase reductase component